VQRDLDHLVVYRSRLYMLVKLPMVTKMAYNGYTYSARSWLLNKARRKDESSIAARLAYYVVNGVRDLKRGLERLLQRQQPVA